MYDHGGRAGAPARRRGRRLRAHWRHKQQSIAMALAAATHHSAPRGECRVLNIAALRGQKTASAAGMRPAPLAEVSGPQEAGVTVGYVVAAVPVGSPPLLQGGDGIDGRTIRYLKVNLARQKKEEEKERRRRREKAKKERRARSGRCGWPGLRRWRSSSWMKGAGPQMHPPRPARRGGRKTGRRRRREFLLHVLLVCSCGDVGSACAFALRFLPGAVFWRSASWLVWTRRTVLQ